MLPHAAKVAAQQMQQSAQLPPGPPTPQAQHWQRVMLLVPSAELPTERANLGRFAIDDLTHLVHEGAISMEMAQRVQASIPPAAAMPVAVPFAMPALVPTVPPMMPGMLHPMLPPMMQSIASPAAVRPRMDATFLPVSAPIMPRMVEPQWMGAAAAAYPSEPQSSRPSAEESSQDTTASDSVAMAGSPSPSPSPSPTLDTPQQSPPMVQVAESENEEAGDEEQECVAAAPRRALLRGTDTCAAPLHVRAAASACAQGGGGDANRALPGVCPPPRRGPHRKRRCVLSRAHPTPLRA